MPSTLVRAYATDQGLPPFFILGHLAKLTPSISQVFHVSFDTSFPGLLRPSSPPSSLWVPLERLSSCTGSWFPQRMAYPSPSTHLYLSLSVSMSLSLCLC